MEEIIRKLSEEFKAAGYELYLVGGCVRDKLLNKNPKDIDMTTNALPQVSRAILTRNIIREAGTIYDVGIEYGTVGITTPDLDIEITTYRGEVYPTESRKPNVIFGTSLTEDLARRDFTINAIAYDPLNDVYIDPYGGILDINRKIIRCVGSDERFDEDPLRMLRAIRFAVKLGFGLAVTMLHPERLKIISAERIREELSKIMLSPDPASGIRLLCDYGLMAQIIPEFMKLKELMQGHNHIKDAYGHTLAVVDRSTLFDFGESNLVFRLACMLHDIGKPMTHTEDAKGVHHFYGHQSEGSYMAENIMQRLKFDSITVGRVKHLVFRHMDPVMMSINNAVDRRSVGRLIHRISMDKYNDIQLLLSLSSCDMSSMVNPRQKFITDLRAMVAEIKIEIPKEIPPLNGDEIMALLGLKPSKMVGEIKNYLAGLVLEGEIKFEDKDELKRLAKEYYNINGNTATKPNL